MNELTKEEVKAITYAIETQLNILNDLMMQTENISHAISLLESAKDKIESVYKG